MYSDISNWAKSKKVTLVAVSKFRAVSDLMPMYAEGQRIFAENRVQELVPKFEAMPKDIRWHLIGHLQRNKVRHIAGFIDTIQSVDSMALLETIDKEAEKHHRSVSVLLQFHIAQEETKFGLNMEEAVEILDRNRLTPFQHIRFAGVMGMASLTEDAGQVRREFASLKGIFTILKNTYFAEEPCFCEISMGMSGDYPIAVEEGATMIRVGSALFV